MLKSFYAELFTSKSVRLIMIELEEWNILNSNKKSRQFWHHLWIHIQQIQRGILGKKMCKKCGGCQMQKKAR